MDRPNNKITNKTNLSYKLCLYDNSNHQNMYSSYNGKAAKLSAGL